VTDTPPSCVKWLVLPIGLLQSAAPMEPQPQLDGGSPCLLWLPTPKALLVLALADAVIRRDVTDPDDMHLVKGKEAVQRVLDGDRPDPPLNGLIVELDAGTQEAEWLEAAVRHADGLNRTGKLLPAAARGFNSKK
jgi:hypothetical protein